MYELPYLGAIEVRGRDAQRFLQAQLSAEIAGLAEGDSRFSGLCQPQGRVIALLLVIRLADGYRLLCARSLREAVLARLKPYVLRDDVQMTPHEDLRLGGAVGDPPDAPHATPLPGLHYLEAGPSGDPGAFRAEELARGVAWLDPDHSGVFLPQMLGHEEIGALSYRKGCFPGQEIIARTRYLGRLKQRALVIQFSGDTLPTEAALSVQGDEQPADAVLVDQAVDADGGQVALLVVRATEPFPVTGIDVAGAPRPAMGRWLEVSSKRPGAAAPGVSNGAGAGGRQP